MSLFGRFVPEDLPQLQETVGTISTPQRDRRGRGTSIEGAFLVISKLRDVALDATEQVSFDEVERSTAPFQLARRALPATSMRTSSKDRFIHQSFVQSRLAKHDVGSCFILSS